jgi:hypothetical protein
MASHQLHGERMDRSLHVEIVDSLLVEARGRRHRLAGTVRAALLELERHSSDRFPGPRQPQRLHEQRALEMALSALLAPAPAIEASRGADLEIAKALRCLDEELELAR